MLHILSRNMIYKRSRLRKYKYSRNSVKFDVRNSAENSLNKSVRKAMAALKAKKRWITWKCNAIQSFMYFFFNSLLPFFLLTINYKNTRYQITINFQEDFVSFLFSHCRINGIAFCGVYFSADKMFFSLGLRINHGGKKNK